MKKKTTKHTPSRKGGAKVGGARVRRVTVTFYPEKKLRDRLICHYIDSFGISTSEAVSSILLECALQHARNMAKEVHVLAEGRIKHLTLAELVIYNLIIHGNPPYVNAQGALYAMRARLREAETKVTR